MPKAKILVVDDESGILSLVTSNLNADGYEYSTAADGPSGLKAARTFQPDLIILDINLPGMDGIELLAQYVATDNNPMKIDSAIKFVGIDPPVPPIR